MRIVLVNTMDINGGAARSAHRLYKGLKAKSQDAKYFVREKNDPDPDIIQFKPDMSPEAVQKRAVAMNRILADYQVYDATRNPNIEIFTHPILDGDESFFKQIPPADIYNLHWIAGLVEYPLFFDPARISQPVVWTLHDQGPFTGGCHYDELCGRYLDACGQCPQLGSDDPNDLSARNLQTKKDALADWPDDKLHIVAPSQWLAAEAKKSALFSRFDVSCIPYGIETDVFRPYDKAEVRNDIGLPQDAKIILFVANHLRLRRKGFKNLMTALSFYPDPDELVLLGVGGSHEENLQLPFRVAQVDYVANDESMAKLYSAADVTAVPSFQDNLPNTMIESLACGTPVVGFDAGGIPDLVIEGETGFLARSERVTDLGSAFVGALNDLERLERMGKAARKMIEARFKLTDQAEAYMPLYQSLIDRAAKS